METFEELKALARSFIEREVRDRLPEYEAKEEFPWPLVRRIAELGFLGVIVPQAYGGVGLGYAPHLALLEEMGAYASLRSVMSVQQSLGRPYPRLRERGAEKGLSSPVGPGRDPRGLCPYRAGFRLGCGHS